MILTEYNEEEHMAALKEYYKEYYEEEMAKAITKAVTKAVADEKKRADAAEEELKAYKLRFGDLNN